MDDVVDIFVIYIHRTINIHLFSLHLYYQGITIFGSNSRYNIYQSLHSIPICQSSLFLHWPSGLPAM